MARETKATKVETKSGPSFSVIALDGLPLEEDQQARLARQAEDDLVIRSIRACKDEAEGAKHDRMRRSEDNVRAYMGEQDWSEKMKGQSTEFLPKTCIAAEQLTAFVKKALLQFGDWFQFTMSESARERSPLTDEQARSLMMHYLENLPDGQHKHTNIAMRAAEGVKVGALESLCIAKVTSARVPRVSWEPNSDGTVTPTRNSVFRLQVEIVPPQDYYPDPTGAGLYEIHTSERDLSYVQERAETGLYDPEIVAQIVEDTKRDETERRKAWQVGQDESQKPGFRKKVVITEYWGTILDEQGGVLYRNVLAATANDKYLIRRPEPNPYWHGESPFVVAPLVRVPFSVWHKALYDPASQLNFALNEVFNLILDGGISSVWGIKQVRSNMLLRPEQISGGIAQGDTLEVKDELPYEGKVLETVTEGKVPPEALAVLNLLQNEFASAVLTSELRMGMLPQKEVRATEVVEQSAGQALTLDAISADLEMNWLGEILRKGWLCILQGADDLASEEVVHTIGLRPAMALALMTPAERFSLLARSGSFKVDGLTATIKKARDFQKIAAFTQIVMQNPLLLGAFIEEFSAKQTLRTLMKSLDIDPRKIQKSPAEMAQMEQELARTIALGGAQRGQGVGPQTGGDGRTPGEVNQLTNPTTGLTINS